MKKKIFLCLLLAKLSLSAFSQSVVWNADVHSFFDNTEFGHSKVQIPQTMAGTHLAPEIGVSLDTIHSVFAGVDVLHEFGSNKVVDYLNIICYYKFDKAPFRFFMGSFPRADVLDNYPRMFFQDSIKNYRPNINGIFWEIGDSKRYFNVWLDWTSRQTQTRHEAFFMGGSGRYEYKNFYAQFFGYMYHFSVVMNLVIYEPLVDDGLFLTSLGYGFEETLTRPLLDIRMGWSIGLERQRSTRIWHKPNGFLFETKAEYRGLGIFNTYYKGTGQMQFHDEYGSKLYWGDPFYHLKEYNRTDLTIDFFKSDFVTTRMIYSLHFGEKEMYHEQSLYVSFNPDNFSKRVGKKYRYLWSGWFK